MKVMVKEVGKPLAVVDTKEKYFGDFARSYLGKDITVERVYLDGMEFIMGVDEDGLVKQLPLNFLMSMQNLFTLFSTLLVQWFLHGVSLAIPMRKKSGILR